MRGRTGSHVALVCRFSIGFVHETLGQIESPVRPPGGAEEASGAVAATTDSATEAVSGRVAGDDRASVTSRAKASSVRTSPSRNFRGRVRCRVGGVVPGRVPGACVQRRSRSARVRSAWRGRACLPGWGGLLLGALCCAAGARLVRARRSSGASGVAFIPIHCNE
jgi:hypothetical protein